MDEVADRGNDGIMVMNDKIEDAIVDSVAKGVDKFKKKPVVDPAMSITTAPPTGCAV